MGSTPEAGVAPRPATPGGGRSDIPLALTPILQIPEYYVLLLVLTWGDSLKIQTRGRGILSEKDYICRIMKKAIKPSKEIDIRRIIYLPVRELKGLSQSDAVSEEMREAAKKELQRREYFNDLMCSASIRFTVHEIKPTRRRSEFSDDFTLDDEFSW